MDRPDVQNPEAQGRYAEVYQGLKKHLISLFQGPLIERQQKARASMDEWVMGTRDFVTFQAGWRERLQSLREVKLEPPESNESSEQMASRLNTDLTKLRRDVRVHVWLKTTELDTELTMPLVERLASRL